MVALVAEQARAACPGDGGDVGFDVEERRAAVNLGLALSEEVEVGAMDQEEIHDSRFTIHDSGEPCGDCRLSIVDCRFALTPGPSPDSCVAGEGRSKVLGRQTARGKSTSRRIRRMQPDWDSLRDKAVLVTGASRGVGARVATLLGEARAKVVVNYRNKGPRAEEVADEVRKLGGQAITACADLTKRDEVRRMFELVRRTYERLDVLVLNASGGLEKEAPPGYAMKLNRDAQVEAVEEALQLMDEGSRVVFVTSHMAHFHGQHEGLDVYEPVAVSKRAGEDALRAMAPELAVRGTSMVVVSGDLIDGTTTPRLMQRQRPGIIDARRDAAGGWLPTIDDFARAIVDAAADTEMETGETVYVGSTR